LKIFEYKKNLKKINVLFVCMGNICRSPIAHGVFQKFVEAELLHKVVGVDSAGTYAYQAGERPDPRARSAAMKRGYDLNKLKARKIEPADFLEFDYVMAMDNENRQDLLDLCEEGQVGKIMLFLDFAKTAGITEVPDPYYGGLNGFETVLDLVEDASHGLLEHIKANHSFYAQ